jgi:hypothetical protein
MRVAALVLVLGCCLFADAFGLEQVRRDRGDWFGFYYGLSYPMADTKNFIENVSWLGVGAEYRRWAGGHFTYAGWIGWNFFDERTDEMILIENGAVSGNQFRYLNYVPIMVGAQFYIGPDGGIRPYLGLSGGTVYRRQRLDIGLFNITESGWYGCFAPELGVMLPLSGIRLPIHLRYVYVLPKGDGVDWSYVSLNFEILFKFF